jgi:hypothetical protein
MGVYITGRIADLRRLTDAQEGRQGHHKSGGFSAAVTGGNGPIPIVNYGKSFP